MDLRFWADLSLVLLAVQALVIGLIVGVVIFFVGKGFTFLLRETPVFFSRVREFVSQVMGYVYLVMDSLAAPFIAVHMASARLSGVLAGIKKLLVARREGQ